MRFFPSIFSHFKLELAFDKEAPQEWNNGGEHSKPERVRTKVRGDTAGRGPVALLSNIYLTKFDRMLEARGHKFVRYADDCNIYVKSPRAAGRVMEGCVKFLKGKLKLKVNRNKSAVGRPLKRKFLGFSLYWSLSPKT
jgi:retron-type reverse transcriptase